MEAIRKNFLPFSLPSIDDEDIQGVVEVLKSGWITTGPKSQEFEKQFASYVNSPEACAITSATAGLHVVLKALNIGPGDEVITSSMTWVSTVNLIELCGATPVFADIDPNTLMITAETIKPVITNKTKLIIPVHYAGAPVDMDPIMYLAKENNILVIEDAAHAAGTEYKGRKIGHLGTSIFSFHPIKNMTTAEGGMICSDDHELLEKTRKYKFHGLSSDAWQRYSQKGSAQKEVWEPGYKYNITDIQSSLGLTQLKKLDEFNKKRAYLASLYDKFFEDIPELTPIKKPLYPHKHTHHLYIVLLDLNKVSLSRNEFVEELKKFNIGTGIHFQAVHLQYYYREIKGLKRGMLPQTEFISDRLFSLPLYPKMTLEDIKDVIFGLKKVVSLFPGKNA